MKDITRIRTCLDQVKALIDAEFQDMDNLDVAFALEYLADKFKEVVRQNTQ